jgi:hypothetical protein
MQAVTINQVKKLKEIYIKLKPDSEKVYVVNHYDRGSKKWSISPCDDIFSERFVKSTKEVFIGFTY